MTVAAWVISHLLERCASQAVSRPLGVEHIWVHPPYFLKGTDREGVMQRFRLDVPLAQFPLEFGLGNVCFLGLFLFFILICSFDGHQMGIESLSEACLCLKAVNKFISIRCWAKLFAPLEEGYLVEDFALSQVIRQKRCFELFIKRNHTLNEGKLIFIFLLSCCNSKIYQFLVPVVIKDF